MDDHPTIANTPHYVLVKERKKTIIRTTLYTTCIILFSVEYVE